MPIGRLLLCATLAIIVVFALMTTVVHTSARALVADAHAVEEALVVARTGAGALDATEAVESWEQLGDVLRAVGRTGVCREIDLASDSDPRPCVT